MHGVPRFTMRSLVVLALCAPALGANPLCAAAAPARERTAAPAEAAPPPGYEWKTDADKGMVMGTIFGAVLGGLFAFQIDEGQSAFAVPADSPGSVASDSMDDDDATTARIFAFTSMTLVGAVVGRLIGAQSRELVPIAADPRAVDVALASLRDRPVP